jgi:acyl carrier protein
VSRYRAKDAFVAGALDALEAWRAASPEDEEEPLLPSGTARYEDMTFEQVLARFQDEAAALLEVEHVDPDMPLWEMGFDSMMLTQLKGGLRNSLGCEVEDDKLFHENATLRVLVQDLLGATPPAVDKSNVAGADPAEAATAQPCPRGPASILRACCQPCRPTAAS